MNEHEQAAIEASGIVITRIPGPKWLDVEVQFKGREAGMVTAKWAGGSFTVPAEILHRTQTAVLGARSAASDNRVICQLHGFSSDGYSWMECPRCAEEKKALMAPKVEKLLHDGSPEF